MSRSPPQISDAVMDVGRMKSLRTASRRFVTRHRAVELRVE